MSLDALRKFRGQAVETLMLELARITQDLTRSEDQYRAVEAQIHADTQRYGRETEQGLTIEALLEWQGRMDSNQAALQRIRQELDRTIVSWQQTKALLVEASLECKLLDRVMEKRQEALRTAALRQEQGATDEVAGRRHATGRAGNS